MHDPVVTQPALTLPAHLPWSGERDRPRAVDRTSARAAQENASRLAHRAAA
jgi:hypothetical protein